MRPEARRAFGSDPENDDRARPSCPERVYELLMDPCGLMPGVTVLEIARRDGRVVGTLIAGWDGWRCHVYRLVVEPSARRLGVARALVAEAQLRAAARGARRIDAMVDIGNAPAISFWKSVGFELDTRDGRWSLVF
jgi:ribosomal protein S18 acetylase RimI-like enzyme